MGIFFHLVLCLLLSFTLCENDILTLPSEDYRPKGMQYQLRRPIVYFYNRLALKYDLNPYTSHLVESQRECSSQKGPFCGFLNSQKLMSKSIENKLPPDLKSLHGLLKASTDSNRKIAVDIQKGLLDVFLISSASHKKIDQFVKKEIEKDFYNERQNYRSKQLKR